MTAPRLARKAGGRYYEVAGERYWSVTTILQAVPKPALTYWAAKEVATWVSQNLAEISGLVKSDPDAAIEVMKNSPWRKRNKAADLGTLIHSVAEAHVLGAPLPEIPEQAEPYIEHYLRFLSDFDVAYEMSEATVANRTYRYAGTLDAIISIEGTRLIGDVKTGSGVYPEAALQLAAYRFAELVVMPDGSEVEMPEVDGGVVVHLSPDHYELRPVRCDQPVFETFLFVREIWRWQEMTSKGVVGEPVAPAPREAAHATA